MVGGCGGFGDKPRALQTYLELLERLGQHSKRWQS
jgi:hypothetical protein